VRGGGGGWGRRRDPMAALRAGPHPMFMYPLSEPVATARTERAAEGGPHTSLVPRGVCTHICKNKRSHMYKGHLSNYLHILYLDIPSPKPSQQQAPSEPQILGHMLPWCYYSVSIHIHEYINGHTCTKEVYVTETLCIDHLSEFVTAGGTDRAAEIWAHASLELRGIYRYVQHEHTYIKDIYLIMYASYEHRSPLRTRRGSMPRASRRSLGTFNTSQYIRT